jgi:hypothetical protein
MARSSYVYLVMDIDGNFYTFTVKKEMVHFLKYTLRNPVEFVFRMDDGPGGQRYDYELSELLAADLG